ncbi:MAG: polyhydroxyalkanoic acid system family protein [Planctomycetaceae bacterium]
MSLLNFSAQHGRSLEEAKSRLAATVAQVESQFGAVIDRHEWNDDGTAVAFFAKGAEVRAWVDPAEVHVTADLPALAALLAAPVLASVRGLVERNFQKRLE